MATTLSDLKARLNVWLRDGTDRTWTTTEKDEILAEAINDPYVYAVVRDTSLTTLANTYSYTAPTGIKAIYDIGIDISSDGIFHHIARDSYDLTNGTIYFNTKSLPTGKTIQIIGKSKLTTGTTDFPANVQEYILHMSMVGAFEMLKTSLTSRFVKNDVTMSDIVQSIATHRARAAELRSSLTNQQLVEI